MNFEDRFPIFSQLIDSIDPADAGAQDQTSVVGTTREPPPSTIDSETPKGSVQVPGADASVAPTAPQEVDPRQAAPPVIITKRQYLHL